MEANTRNLKRLLPHGSLGVIAKKIGISAAAVGQALKDGRPGHKAVQEALRMARESGALETAHELAELIPVAQAA
jgi:hypothetical protein